MVDKIAEQFEAWAKIDGGYDLSKLGDVYDRSPAFYALAGYRAAHDDANAVLREMGHDREDTMFVSLNMTKEQFAALNDAVCEWGESPEETIAVACRGAMRAEDNWDLESRSR